MDNVIELISKELRKAVQLRVNGKSLPDATLSDVCVMNAKECDNPNCNYSFSGSARVKRFMLDRNAYLEENSSIRGYAQVDFEKEKVTIIGEVVADGLSHLF